MGLLSERGLAWTEKASVRGKCSEEEDGGNGGKVGNRRTSLPLASGYVRDAEGRETTAFLHSSPTVW